MAGYRTNRVETSVDDDLDAVINAWAARLAGVRPGDPIPYGFRSMAVHDMLAHAARTISEEDTHDLSQYLRAPKN